MPLNGNIRKFRYDLFLNDKQIFESLGDNLIDITKTKLVKIIEDVIEKTGHEIVCSVKPENISPNDELYSVDFENNAVCVETLISGRHVFVGKGAGALPTGSAVLEDLKRLLDGYSYQVSKRVKTVA